MTGGSGSAENFLGGLTPTQRLRFERIKQLRAVGNKVDLQARNNDGSPVEHSGTVSKVEEEQGSFEVTTEGGEVIRFNSSGISMPWNRQLQIKL